MGFIQWLGEIVKNLLNLKSGSYRADLDQEKRDEEADRLGNASKVARDNIKALDSRTDIDRILGKETLTHDDEKRLIYDIEEILRNNRTTLDIAQNDVQMLDERFEKLLKDSKKDATLEKKEKRDWHKYAQVLVKAQKHLKAEVQAEREEEKTESQLAKEGEDTTDQEKVIHRQEQEAKEEYRKDEQDVNIALEEETAISEYQKVNQQFMEIIALLHKQVIKPALKFKDMNSIKGILEELETRFEKEVMPIWDEKAKLFYLENKLEKQTA